MDNSTLAHARILWDYHHVNLPLRVSDCILALGSHDLRVAERAAQLYLDKWAPKIIFSGGLGRLTSDIWTISEADQFAAVAVAAGVPVTDIIVENRSTNTGENIAFTRELLVSLNLSPQSFLVVQKPYMERRSFATFQKVWPEKDVIVTSPQISFDNYPTPEISMKSVINIMVGDLQRIIDYPALGYQIYQHVPPRVMKAYEQLIELGYTEQLAYNSNR